MESFEDLHDQIARLLSGPDAVPVNPILVEPLKDIMSGDTVRMTVLPAKVDLAYSFDHDGKEVVHTYEMPEGNVCLAYDNVPCCFMPDATGTLIDEACKGPVELEVTCTQNHLGRPDYTASWYECDPSQAEANRMAKIAAPQLEEARAIWFDIERDEWLFPFHVESTMFMPLSMELDDDGESPDIVFADSQGAKIFAITHEMDAYKGLMGYIEKEPEKLFVMQNTDEHGAFYRMRLVFVE